jgi:hypothetical protein
MISTTPFSAGELSPPEARSTFADRSSVRSVVCPRVFPDAEARQQLSDFGVMNLFPSQLEFRG